ncbi:MAG: CBS domain-containing protein [Pseudomonadota bacterium]
MRIATTHKNTDFDGLASVMAATLIFPDTVAVIPTVVNPNLKGFLSIHKDLFSIWSPAEVDLEVVSELIVVDVNRWDRLDSLQPLRDRKELTIRLWDHHESEGDIDAQHVCQEPVGATVTLMMRMIRERRLLLTPIQATLFLAGIYEDTGNLTFSATQAEDAYAAAYLLERKADLGILNSFLKPAYGAKQKEVLYEMLQDASRETINGHTVSIRHMRISGHIDRLAVVVRMFREIMNVEAAFGLFTDVDKKRTMIIARSDVEDLDVGTMMKSLGGGGHPGAGSAVVKNANPEAVADLLRELLAGNQQASVQISDLMSFPVFSIHADTSMREAAAMLREKGCTGVPVVDGEGIVGILSRRDFRKIKNEKRLDAPVKAFMSKSVVTISPGRSPMYAARLMVKHDIGRLPVVEDGKLIGIITRSDAMMYFYDLLPD